MTEYPERPGTLAFGLVAMVALSLPTLMMCALFTELYKKHPEAGGPER